MTFFFVVLLAGVTTGLTMVIRIPIPGTGGYLNLGDIAVVFCGLFLRRWRGAVAGGMGSAVADLIGGFYIFSPVTLIAKGLEGLVAGTLAVRSRYWLILSGTLMVAGYFLAELFLPNMGWAAALSELPFNLLQAAVGATGGLAVYRAVTLALPRSGGSGGAHGEAE